MSPADVQSFSCCSPFIACAETACRFQAVAEAERPDIAMSRYWSGPFVGGVQVSMLLVNPACQIQAIRNKGLCLCASVCVCLRVCECPCLSLSVSALVRPGHSRGASNPHKSRALSRVSSSRVDPRDVLFLLEERVSPSAQGLHGGAPQSELQLEVSQPQRMRQRAGVGSLSWSSCPEEAFVGGSKLGGRGLV